MISKSSVLIVSFHAIKTFEQQSRGEAGARVVRMRLCVAMHMAIDQLRARAASFHAILVVVLISTR